MFCKNCGQEIDDKAVVCPHCGVAQREMSYETIKDDGGVGWGLLGCCIPVENSQGSRNRSPCVSRICCNLVSLCLCLRTWWSYGFLIYEYPIQIPANSLWMSSASRAFILY